MSEMTVYLTRMAIQSIDFSTYSPSIVVVSAAYAATAFLKNSEAYKCNETTMFCIEARKIIF